MANLVGDEKPCEIRELGIFFFFVCLPRNVSFFRARNASPVCRGREKHNAGVAASSPIVAGVFIYPGNQRDNE